MVTECDQTCAAPVPADIATSLSNDHALHNFFHATAGKKYYLERPDVEQVAGARRAQHVLVVPEEVDHVLDGVGLAAAAPAVRKSTPAEIERTERQTCQQQKRLPIEQQPQQVELQT